MRIPWFSDRAAREDAILAAIQAVQSRIADREAVESDRERASADLDQIREQLTGTGQEIAEIRDELGRLKIALADGIEHEERRERRIEATVRRARKQLAEVGVESAGIEAEFEQLRLLDGGGGEEGELPAVSEEVASGAGDSSSSVAGVSVEQLQRARGMM